ncbi:MAG: bifunctional 5,10-methylene-tetrahydrofolate dehydrogenase/5,10-methylene-tetrahydrofolate cyclohydrolase [Bacteroidales bacterium]|nr:bifunctional 5,10-methylene-tetrahydrofolate dehydrogenase/5,10-methylene-tetrahydrofolate cyclohydrolase [Candidatus Egerieousia equi]
MAILIDGKLTAAQIKERIKATVETSVANGGKRPHLAAVLVGNDGASATYVASKEKACADVGFKSTVIKMKEETSQDELLAVVKRLNEDHDIDGIIVQLPLPKHLNEQVVIKNIDYHKDVDGFHLANVGKMVLNMPGFLPATPFGILTLLKQYNIETRGKNCVILGRSNIVGRPMANLLSQKGLMADCTVTLCNSKTKDIAYYTRNADIIIAAIGVPEFLKGDMVKEGVVVIDVGITRIPDSTKPRGYRIVGDVDFKQVEPKASYISPVPGGVGPMTIVSLLENTLKSAQGKKLTWV